MGSVANIISSTIITIDSSPLISPFNDRMPVIEQPQFFALWLSNDPIPPEELMRVLILYPESELDSYPVSTLVNKPGVDREECIAPVDLLAF
jgi:putative SOS response-associated peptidase YedK